MQEMPKVKTSWRQRFRNKKCSELIVIVIRIQIKQFPLQFIINQISQMQLQEQKKHSYLDEYKILKTLGAGYHAQVKLGVDSNGNYVAIKKYKKETANLATLQHELGIMKNLQHQNLVKLIDVRENATYKKQDETTYKCFAIVLQYVGGGQLFDFIADTGKFSQIVARTYFHQMMNGLYYMHGKGYAHRDIKPENILLSHQFVLKLADFGFSCVLKGKDGTGVLHTKLGTQGYMAPQIPTKNYNGAKADIFAAGVILFIMYAGNPPFQKAMPNDPYYKLIKEKKTDVFWKAHSRRRAVNYFTQQFKDLFSRMVAFNPEERPKIQEIAGHKWVKGAVCTHGQIKQQFSLRQQKLNVVLEQRRKEQQKQKIQNMTAVTSQGAISNRGDQQVESPFLQIYNNQHLLKRSLPVFQVITKDDVIVKEQASYVVSILKQYFKTFQIKINEQAQEDMEEDDSNTLKVSKVSDQQGDKINVQFSYSDKIQGEQFTQNVEINILLGNNKKGNLVIRFQRQDGNILYFKKITNQMKNKFAYAIQN